MCFQLTTLIFRATLGFHLLPENLALSTLWSCSTATVAMTTRTEKPLWQNEAFNRVVHERERDGICMVSLPLALVQGRAVQLIRCWSRHTHSRQGLSSGFQLSRNWNTHTRNWCRIQSIRTESLFLTMQSNVYCTWVVPLEQNGVHWHNGFGFIAYFKIYMVVSYCFSLLKHLQCLLLMHCKLLWIWISAKCINVIDVRSLRNCF